MPLEWVAIRYGEFGFKYGTDDKGHAAALVLAVFLLILLTVLLIVGAIVDRPWIKEALQIIGVAFTFVAGVAIGKSAGPH